MTTAKPFVTQTGQTGEFFVFPDPPKHPEDKMTSFDHLTITGNAHYLAIRIWATPKLRWWQATATLPWRLPETWPESGTLIFWWPSASTRRSTKPATPTSSKIRGKPPDLVMEIASRHTGRVDVTAKRDDYAALDIPEYWRFDETGEYHGSRLAGDRLENGAYVSTANRRTAGRHIARLQCRTELELALGARSTALARPLYWRIRANLRKRTRRPPPGRGARPPTGSATPPHKLTGKQPTAPTNRLN